MTEAGRPRVGLLLIASQRFHDLGQGTRRGPYHARKQDHAENVVRLLGQDLEVCFPGVVYGQADLRGAIALFRTESVDFVMAEFLSWSEDASWIGFLRDSGDFPVLFTHTVRPEPGFEDTESEDDFIEFLSAGALVGSLEASGSIGRVGSRFVRVVVGDAGRVTEEAVLFGRAAKVRSSLRQASVGLVGSYNEIMWSTYVDPYNIFTKLGPTIHFVSYSDLALEIAGVTDGDAEAYVRDLSARHEVLPDVEAGKFRESARASLAVARIAERMGLDITVLNDVDHALFRAIGLRPGFYHPWFNEHGAVMVPEGDVGSGVAAFLLKRLSGKSVSYIEPFYIDARSGCFAGGHAGPNDHTDPAVARRVKIARDVRFAKTSYRFAGAPFAWYRFSPGAKTMAHVSENNGRFRLVCTMVDALEGTHFITSYSHGMFRPHVPVERLFERIMAIGATQHFAIADGDWRRSLGELAPMAGFEFHTLE